MKNITYLLGAGASYHSLPLLATMSERMKAYSSFLKLALKKGEIKNDFAHKFILELDHLLIAEKQSTSIDAYAKELSNSNNHLKLLHLKAILSSYLIFEQLVKPEDFKIFLDEDQSIAIPDSTLEMIKNPIDKRYRTFWAEYTDQSKKLPKNIKIISWNYDMQLEFSFSRFSQYSLEMVQQELQIFPSEQKEIRTDCFCVLKLNGTAGLLDTSGSSRFSNLFDLSKHHLTPTNLSYLIDLLKNNYFRSFSNPVFAFAWENEGFTNKARSMAKEILSETEILVIIGYSFPSFNWSVDQEIFRNIKKLEKVYYQAPENEVDFLKTQMDAIHPDLKGRTMGIFNLRSFYIPVESKAASL